MVKVSRNKVPHVQVLPTRHLRAIYVTMRLSPFVELRCRQLCLTPKKRLRKKKIGKGRFHALGDPKRQPNESKNPYVGGVNNVGAFRKVTVRTRRSGMRLIFDVIVELLWPGRAHDRIQGHHTRLVSGPFWGERHPTRVYQEGMESGRQKITSAGTQNKGKKVTEA